MGEIWDLPARTAMEYIDNRQPQVKVAGDFVKIGRSTIDRPSKIVGNGRKRGTQQFAETNYSLRLMESMGTCICHNEPMLLGAF